MTIRNRLFGATILRGPEGGEGSGAGGGAGGAGTPAGTGDAGGAGGANWFTAAGYDAETTGQFQTQGWDKLTPAAAAAAAAKYQRETQALVGAPPSEIVRLPKEPGDPAWKQVYQRLGAPADPKDYDFSSVKIGDKDLPTERVEALRAQAADLNLSKDAATRFAQQQVKAEQDAAAATATARTAKVQEERAALDKEWGLNKDANLFVAKQAAAKLGASPEAIRALEEAVGYKNVMEMFRKIGSAIGEDKFIANTGANPGVMTREMAMSRKAELMKDTAWTQKYLGGDTSAVKEMTGLLTIITGESGDYSAA